MTQSDTGTCPDCGGPTEKEVNGLFEDKRCQDCGRIVGGGRLVEVTEA